MSNYPECDFSVCIYDERYEFFVDADSGKLALRAFNQCGYDSTNTDVVKFLEYCAKNFPDLYMKNVTPQMIIEYT